MEACSYCHVNTHFSFRMNNLEEGEKIMNIYNKKLDFSLAVLVASLPTYPLLSAEIGESSRCKGA